MRFEIRRFLGSYQGMNGRDGRSGVGQYNRRVHVCPRLLISDQNRARRGIKPQTQASFPIPRLCCVVNHSSFVFFRR